MKKTFNEKIFNQTDCDLEVLRLNDLAAKVEKMITTLADEGIPTDEDFLKKITETDNSCWNYFLAERKKRLSGFIPNAEKMEIIRMYEEVFDKVNPIVQDAKRVLDSKEITLKGDTVDYPEIEKKAKARATVTVDSEAMEKYYDEVLIFKQAIDRFRKYEVDNHLPDFFNDGVLYRQDNARRWSDRMNFTKFFEEPSIPLFETIMQDTFKIEK